MYLYTLLIENKELVKLIYTVIIGFICLAIVVKTNRIFRLSLHQGIRYFRNAFLFYGLAFISRYILTLIYDLSAISIFVYASIIKIIFEFFLLMAAFSLLYSLLWKRLDGRSFSASSLLNANILLFYMLAFILSLLDYAWDTYSFMFLSQIVIFSFASGMCFAKYSDIEVQKIPGSKAKLERGRKTEELGGDKSGFLRLYFIVILLNLAAWVINFVVASFFEWQQSGVIGTYVINLAIFFLLLYAVSSATKR